MFFLFLLCCCHGDVTSSLCFQFEGLPTYPDVGRMWQIVDKYQVTKFYTAPTAIRLLMKYGSDPVQKWATRFRSNSETRTRPESAFFAFFKGTNANRWRFWERWASPSTRRRGSGTTAWWGRNDVRSSTPSGRLKPSVLTRPVGLRRCRHDDTVQSLSVSLAFRVDTCWLLCRRRRLWNPDPLWVNDPVRLLCNYIYMYIQYMWVCVFLIKCLNMWLSVLRRFRSSACCRPSWTSLEKSWKGRVKDTWSGLNMLLSCRIFSPSPCVDGAPLLRRCSSSRGPAWCGAFTGTTRDSKPRTSRNSRDITSPGTVRHGYLYLHQPFRSHPTLSSSPVSTVRLP